MTAPGTLVNGHDVGRYCDRTGQEHRVRIREVRSAWEILDFAASEVTVVDRLEGPDESRATAEAVAVDWLGQQR